MHRAPRLGTRGSALAIAQARAVAAAIETAQGWPAGRVELVPITTSGDKIKDRPLAEFGGKGLWTKELDSALLAGEIDFAVHSAKDIEVVRPEAIRLAAVLARTHIADRLVGAATIGELRAGAVVGTSSPRRKAQLLAARPDLVVVTLRGNVETRLRKLSAGEADATILSSAGLHRLGLDEVGTPVPLDLMLPAPGQGAIAVECRAGDTDWSALLAEVDDESSHRSVAAERAFARALGGSCHSPVAALATVDGDVLHLAAEILSEDGAERIRDQARFEGDDEEQAAALALLALLLSSSLPIVVMLASLGSPDAGLLLGGYLAAFLSGALLLAVGLVVSCLSRDQVTAFVLTAVAGAALVLLGHERVVAVLDGLAPQLRGGTWLARRVSLLPPFQALGRGLVTLDALLYFVGGCAACLWINARLVARLRD